MKHVFKKYFIKYYPTNPQRLKIFCPFPIQVPIEQYVEIENNNYAEQRYFTNNRTEARVNLLRGKFTPKRSGAHASRGDIVHRYNSIVTEYRQLFLFSHRVVESSEYRECFSTKGKTQYTNYKATEILPAFCYSGLFINKSKTYIPLQ